MISFLAYSLLSLAQLGPQAKTVYKCVNPVTEQIEFSEQACPGAKVVQKIRTRDQVLPVRPSLPAGIPGRGGQVSPKLEEIVKPQQRMTVPNVPERCRVEAFAIRRDIDRRVGEADRTLRDSESQLARNQKDLQSARGSLVEGAWMPQLQSERSLLESTRLAATEDRARALREEPALFAGLLARCANSSTKAKGGS